MWKFARTVYRLDHKAFDHHFEILTLLTNEHIKIIKLSPDDELYYNGHLPERLDKFITTRERRKSQYESYRAKKRRRLE